MSLYLYALVSAALAGPAGTGVAGEPLALLPSGGLLTVVGKVAARPAVTAETLARHDVTIRRLTGLVPALLPARFGECLSDERELAQVLAPLAPEIARALALVEGCVQMTLRVFGEPEEAVAAGAGPGTPQGLGPGTQYLAARRRATSPGLLDGIPEWIALRQALKPLLRAERVERRSGPPGRLLATVHDLVRQGETAGYSRIVGLRSGSLGGRKLTVSGPWPPYAFAPEGLR
jgi:gas vesicle protein GvpL/GvpF